MFFLTFLKGFYRSHFSIIFTIIFAFFFEILLPLRTSGQEKVSLEKAIELTISSNLQIRKDKINEQKADEDLKQSKRNLLPTLGINSSGFANWGRTLDPVSYSYTTQNTLTSSSAVTSNFILYQGGIRRNKIEQADMSSEIYKYNTLIDQNSLTLSVVSTFLNILNIQDQLKASQVQKAMAENQLEIEIQTFEAGKKTLADVSRAKSEVAKVELNIINFQNKLSSQKVELKQLMNVDPLDEIAIDKPKDSEEKINHMSLSAIYSAALKNLPDIKQSQKELKLNAKSLDIAKGNLYPTLSIVGSVSSNYSHLNQSNFIFTYAPDPFLLQYKNHLSEYVGLSLSFPIFNGLNARSTVTKAKLDLENSSINDKLVKESIFKIVNQAYQDLLTANQTYITDKEIFAYTKETFQITEKRYRGGKVSSLDFNEAQDSMNKAEIELIRAKYDLIFKNKVIFFFLGEPISY